MNIKTLILSVIALFAMTTTAQAQKIGHINSSELMQDLPALDTIKVQLEALTKEYQNVLQAIAKELEDKQTYWEGSPTTDEAILQIRQQDYQTLVTRYQEKQQEAQDALAKREADLMQPLVKNLREVVTEVAKAKGYTYVFDGSEGGGMIYGDPSHDLMEAVKEKLKTTKL